MKPTQAHPLTPSCRRSRAIARVFALAAILAAAFFPANLHAAAATNLWTGAGGDDLFSNGANWTNATPPGALGSTANTDQGLFAAESGGLPNYLVNLDAARSLGSIYFISGASAYGFSGSDLRLNSSTAIYLDPTLTTGTNTIGNNILLGGSITFQNKSAQASGTAGTLVINGNITQDPSVSVARTFVLTGNSLGVAGALASSGTVVVNGTISDGPTAGASLNVKIGSQGTGIVRLDGSNTFSGGVNINQGILLVGHNNALGTGNFGFSAGALAADGASPRTITNAWATSWTTTYSDAIIGSPSTLGSAGNFSINTTNTGKLTLSGNGTLTALAASTPRKFTFYTDVELSGIVGADANVNEFRISGPSLNNAPCVFTLSGANTFDLPVTLNNGIVSINTIGNVGAGVGTSLGKASTAATGTINIVGANQGTTLRYTGGVTTTDRIISINNNSVNQGLDASGTGPITFTSPLAYGGTLTTARTLTLSGTNTSDNAFYGVITNTGGLGSTTSLVKTGPGTWVLSDTNTYTGVTTIQNGVLKVSSLNKWSGGSASSSLGAPTTIGNGTITLGSSTNTATLIYTGAGETTDRRPDLAGTTGGGVIEQAGSGLLKFTAITTPSGAGSKTLTLRGSTLGTGEIAAAIKDNSLGVNTTSLLKDGTGTWTLSGVNLYTGPTTISGGTLTVGVSGSLGGGFYSSDITNNGTLHYSSSAAQTLSGVISGTGDLIQNGPGTLALSGVSTYSGNTTVNGGMLGGTGTISGAVTVQAGGTLSPGASVGTLTISNNLALAGNLFIELDKSLVQSNDFVFVTGTLVNSGTGTLTVTNLGPALIAGDAFQLFNQSVINGNALTIVGPPGVTFTNKLAYGGSIEVLSAFSTATYPTNITATVSDSTLSLSWPATHLGWILQTNSVGLLNTGDWFAYPGSDAVTSVDITIDPTKPNVFFRLVLP